MVRYRSMANILSAHAGCNLCNTSFSFEVLNYHPVRVIDITQPSLPNRLNVRFIDLIACCMIYPKYIIKAKRTFMYHIRKITFQHFRSGIIASIHQCLTETNKGDWISKRTGQIQLLQIQSITHVMQWNK